MYLQGFGNYHQTEAITDALPKNQNAPQVSPLGLYTEQISGSAFTVERHRSLYTWLYRTLPSVTQGYYYPSELTLIKPYQSELSPNPLRWSPLDYNTQKNTDFIQGLFHIAGTSLLQVYTYFCNCSMQDTYFTSHDGEYLIVPFEGPIRIATELGILETSPGMIAVIPRGVKFKIILLDKEAKGYVCENMGFPLRLPELGVIGANGLANPRHFMYPTAAYESSTSACTILCKSQNVLWSAQCDHSPLNVVAWQGTYAPYVYDMSLFNTINTVGFDHADPSIFTVLRSESAVPNISNLDFVIFPPRWVVSEHTFRPAYFHRNCMSEFMGLIFGTYEGKIDKNGFLPGGFSIHNAMTPHGPDNNAYQKAVSDTLKPEYLNSLAFMFETNQPWKVTEQALQHVCFQLDYMSCWKGFRAAKC